MDQQPWSLKTSFNASIAGLEAQGEHDESEARTAWRVIPPERSQDENYQIGPVVEIEDQTSRPTVVPKPAFEFVRMDTTSPGEKERNRAKIRSRAAMKAFRERYPSETPSRQKSLERGPLGSGGILPAAVVEAFSHAYEMNVLTRTPESGRRDPFRTYPMEEISPYDEFVLKHSTSVLWPPIIPALEGRSHLGLWLQRTLSNPLAMHALMFGAASHIIFLQKKSNVSQVDASRRRLHHKVQTLRLVNEELQSPNLQNLDDILIAVLALATDGVDNLSHQDVVSYSPFHPPFQDAMWLSVFGSALYNKAHVAGMVSIVKLRGGLDNIEWSGLGAQIYYNDVIVATQDFRHPFYPIPISERPPSSSTAFLDPSRSVPYLQLCTAPELGTGFTEDLLQSPYIPAEFFTVMNTLVEYTAALEVWSRGIIAIPSMFELISRRNATHHALLSLPFASELTSPDGNPKGMDFYESLRLGAVLFSVAVVFPIPPATGVLQGLVVRLRSAILVVSSGNRLGLLSDGLGGKGWDGFERTCLWLCVLGGIASEGMVERALFVDMARDLKRKLELESWQHIEREMKRYLWLESACDFGGREFWTEVGERERSLSRDSMETNDGRQGRSPVY